MTELRFFETNPTFATGERDVLFSAMQLLKYPEADIRLAVNSIPDSSPGRSSAAILRSI